MTGTIQERLGMMVNGSSVQIVLVNGYTLDAEITAVFKDHIEVSSKRDARLTLTAVVPIPAILMVTERYDQKVVH